LPEHLNNAADSASGILGRRQAVRHRILVPALGGSNPPAPAIRIDNWILKIEKDTRLIKKENEAAIALPDMQR
jgi:hypothetical protein